MRKRIDLVIVLVACLLIFSGFVVMAQGHPYNDNREYRDFKQFVDRSSTEASPPGPPASWARVQSLVQALARQARMVEATDAVMETYFMIMAGLERELALTGAPPDVSMRLRSATWKVEEGDSPQGTPFLEQMARKRFKDIHKKLESWRMISQLRRAMGRFSHNPVNAYQYYSPTAHLRKMKPEARGKSRIKLTAQEWNLLEYSNKLKVVKLFLYPRGYGYVFRVKGYKGEECRQYDIIWAWEDGKWMIQRIESVNPE